MTLDVKDPEQVPKSATITNKIRMVFLIAMTKYKDRTRKEVRKESQIDSEHYN